MSRLFYVIILCLTLSLQARDDAERFLISNFEHPLMHIMNDLIRQSYKDIGIDIEFVTRPDAHGLKMLNAGQVDADVIRADYMVNRYPNILPVQPVLLRPQMIIFCRKNIPCNADILKNKNVVIHGYSYLTDSLRMRYQENVSADFFKMKNYDLTVEQLQDGKIDYLMMSMIKGRMPEVLKTEFNHVVLYEYETHHMIHRRHQHLVTQLSAALEKNLVKLQITGSKRVTIQNHPGSF